MILASLYCQWVLQSTQALITARSRGVTKEQAVMVADDIADQDSRTTARVLIWYVYVANSDRRSPPSKVLELVGRACMSSEVNALTQKVDK